MPRLDSLAQMRLSARCEPGTRLLVMTAKKPGYDDAQRVVIERSLSDLKSFLETLPEVEVVWRVTRGLADSLGVQNRLKELETLELSGVLAEVDAVVTTPSTALLESMLALRPVAALDYFNAPRFVGTAWTISANTHIAIVIPELLQPPAAKMLFQAECLRDSLLCEGSSASRVHRLIEVMARLGRECRSENIPLRMGANLLESAESFGPGMLPVLSELYPGQAGFQERDTEALRSRLLRLEKDYARLRRDSLLARIGRRVRRIVSL